MTETGRKIRLHEGHLLPVLARGALVAAGAIVMLAAVKPPPRLIYSYHAQHLAAFYVLSLCSATAFKKTKVLSLASMWAAVAVVFEAVRSLDPLHVHTSYASALADGAGILGAFAPMLAQKFRARFD